MRRNDFKRSDISLEKASAPHQGWSGTLPMRAAHPEPAWWTTWHVWKRILQIAAAITGLSYLQINYRQWQTAIDANRLALQNAIRDQRPYVVCNGMTNKSHFAQGEYSYWIIGISNSGKSPAVRCSGHFAMGIGDPATLARDADRWFAKIETAPNVFSGPTVTLPPNAPQPTPDPYAPGEHEDWHMPIWGQVYGTIPSPVRLTQPLVEQI